MELKKLRVEYRENPIGLDVKKPRFSWILQSEKENCMQSMYQIQVLEQDAFGNVSDIVWDTGKVESEQSVLVEYAGDELKPETAYEARIHVWDNQMDEAEETIWFETGLIDPEKMCAQWITSGFPEEEKACPVFVYEMKAAKKVVKARMYATAHGLYEITINRNKVGDAFFAPGWTSYHQRLQYQTYDVTGLICEENRIEVTVADGWYKGPFGLMLTPYIYGDKTALLAELHLIYEDGTSEIIGTNEAWKVTSGEIRERQIYYGEVIDTT